MSKYDFPVTSAALKSGNNSISLQLEMVGVGKSVLELGCATGQVTRVLTKQRQCLVVGIEYDPVSADVARAYANEVIVADLESEQSLAEIKGDYDVILAGDVLEHLRQPALLMRRLRHLLRPNGYWVISVPNIAHWSVRKELLMGRFNFTQTGVMDATHLRWFTTRTLREMVQGAGYEIAQMEAASTVPLQDVLHLRGLSSWIGHKRIRPGFFGIQLVVRADPSGDAG